MTPKHNPQRSGEMSLFDHLGELRSCILKSILAVLVGAVCCYSYSTEVFEFLNRPYFASFPGAILIGTSPAEAFMLKIKVAIYCGLLVTSPIIFHQFWIFISPGLYEHERRMVLPFVFITSTLFLFGAWFCFHWVLPIALSFFNQEYQSIGVSPNIKVSEHLSTIIQGTLAFGVVFELPVLAYFLGRGGIITSQMLISSGRVAIAAIFIISAVLTPPDVLSQFLMAGPLLMLYGLSILIVKAVEKKGQELIISEKSN